MSRHGTRLVNGLKATPRRGAPLPRRRARWRRLFLFMFLCWEVEPLSRGGFAVAFHGPPPGGGASRRWEDFRLCVTARPRVGGRRAVGRWCQLSWWSSSWPTPYGGPVVLVCVVVRKGCVSVLTGRVIFGELFGVKQVWEVFCMVFCIFYSFSRERARARRDGIRHSGIWSELGCPLAWVAEVNRPWLGLLIPRFQIPIPAPKGPQRAKRFRIPRVRRLKLQFPYCNVT